MGFPSIGSLKQCLSTDILAHLLEQIGQAAEPAAHRSINRRVHPKQSPSRRATTSAPSPSPGSWSPREASSRIPVPHAPLSPGKPERTTTSCAHNTTADARSNRALLPHTQQQGSRNPSLRVALQLPRPRTRSGNWFVCDLQICCHFTTQNSETDLKTNDETFTFLICLFVLFPQLTFIGSSFLYSLENKFGLRRP